MTKTKFASKAEQRRAEQADLARAKRERDALREERTRQEAKTLALPAKVERLENGLPLREVLSVISPVTIKRPKRMEHKTKDGQRPISFSEACRMFPHRFTMDNIPAWALKPCARAGGKFPGPHYGSDKEWYENTEFPRVNDHQGKRYMRQNKPTYPVGKWLDTPYVDLGLLSNNQVRKIDRLAKKA